MALCTIRKVSNRNSSDDEKHLATTREQMRYGNGKLHYIFLADRSWRLHRVNPPGNFYKATRHEGLLRFIPEGLNRKVGILYFDQVNLRGTMRFYKCHNRVTSFNRENNMV